MILDRTQRSNLEDELAALMHVVETDLSVVIQAECDRLLDAIYAGLMEPQC